MFISYFDRSGSQTVNAVSRSGGQKKKWFIFGPAVIGQILDKQSKKPTATALAFG